MSTLPLPNKEGIDATLSASLKASFLDCYSSDLYTRWQNEAYDDVTFTFDKDKMDSVFDDDSKQSSEGTATANFSPLHAHGCLLSLLSPVFKTMLKNKCSANQEPKAQAAQPKPQGQDDELPQEDIAEQDDAGKREVTGPTFEITDISRALFESFLLYFYAQCPPLTVENVGAFFFLAGKYKVTGLKKLCDAFLKQSMNMNTIVTIVGSLHTYKQDPLFEHCRVWMKSQSSCPKEIISLFGSDAFTGAHYRTVSVLLEGFGSIGGVDPLHVWPHVVRWRKRHTYVNTAPIMRHFPFHRLTVEQVCTHILPDNILSQEAAWNILMRNTDGHNKTLAEFCRVAVNGKGSLLAMQRVRYRIEYRRVRGNDCRKEHKFEMDMVDGVNARSWGLHVTLTGSDDATAGFKVVAQEELAFRDKKCKVAAGDFFEVEWDALQSRLTVYFSRDPEGTVFYLCEDVKTNNRLVPRFRADSDNFTFTIRYM